jgi:hypothetical protein
MSDRAKRLVVAAAVITASLSTSVVSDLRDAMFVMACCAKTKYQCAGVGTPDDCCRRMHHTSRPGTTAIVKVASTADVAIVAPTIASVYESFAPEPPAASADFKRPHDPPHLNTFSLLI